MPDEVRTIGELLDRLPPVEKGRPCPIIEAICLNLIRIRQALAGHTSEDLLALKQTAEATAYFIGRELARRDAALIDTLCNKEN